MVQCALQIVLNASTKTIVWFVSLDILDSPIVLEFIVLLTAHLELS